MITHRPGLESLYEFPDVDPKIAVVIPEADTELLATPAQKPLAESQASVEEGVRLAQAAEDERIAAAAEVPQHEAI